MKRVDIFLKKYYTDTHDVDEDLKTTIKCGGYWPYENAEGITRRSLDEPPINTWDSVASSNVQNIELYGLS